MSTLNGTPGTVNVITGKEAGKVKLLGKPTPFTITPKNKDGVAKLASMGITEFQRLVYKTTVFTTHDEELVKLIKERKLGEIELTAAEDSKPEAIRVQESGYLSRMELIEYNKEDQRALWADPKTYQDNPSLLGKIPNLNDLATASVE